MRSNTARVLAGIAAVAVAVILLIVLKDGSDDSGESSADGGAATGTEKAGEGKPATAAIPTIVIKDGEPVGGVRSLTYKEGDRIRFAVDSDVSDEIHVHGYDLMKDVEAGGSVRFHFPASIEGIFEAELEGRKVQIAEITVNP